MLNCTSVHHCGICFTNFTLGIIFAPSLLQIYDKLENIDAEIRKRENEGTGITWHQVQVIAFLHKKVNISCSTFVLNCVAVIDSLQGSILEDILMIELKIMLVLRLD